jgi:hypothetical protein
MFSEEPSSWKDRILRVVVGIFLFLLVSMLIITFLPGDAEKSFVSLLTGRSASDAGKIGRRTVPLDAFQITLRQCYSQYKAYAPQLADNMEILENCAYTRIRQLYISEFIGESIGYEVSSLRVKRDVLEEAKSIHASRLDQPGYDPEEDISSLQDVYSDLIRGVPLPYRKDLARAQGLYEDSIQFQIPILPKDQEISKNTDSSTLSLRYIAFRETDLMNSLNPTVSDQEIKAEYDKEVSENKNPLTPIPSLAERSELIKKKLVFEKKRKEAEAITAQLEQAKQNNSLEELAKILKLGIQTTGKINLNKLSTWKPSNGEPITLLGMDAFWKQVKTPGAKNAIYGPTYDGDIKIYWEEPEVNLSTNPVILTTSPSDIQSREDGFAFYMEAVDSISKEFNIERNKALRKEN